MRKIIYIPVNRQRMAEVHQQLYRNAAEVDNQKGSITLDKKQHEYKEI